MVSYPHSQASIVANGIYKIDLAATDLNGDVITLSLKEQARAICKDCGSFKIAIHIPSIRKCYDCGGSSIINYPNYLPEEQAERYVKALSDKEVKR